MTEEKGRKYMEERETNEKVIKFIKKEITKKNETVCNGQCEEINAVQMQGLTRICYDKFQGRPSIMVEIQDQVMECLLDTGATTNVMSWNQFQKLRNVQLKPTGDMLRCANDSLLETKGKAELEVTINQERRLVMFTIVNKMTPDVIGGIGMQAQFGIELRWNKQEEVKERQEHISNIEAQFGQKFTGLDRLKKANDVLKISDKNIRKIIEINQEVFMANDWDIGCTKLVKHHIETKGNPINIKPRRQPMNLEDKIDAAILNLWENNIIKKCNSPWNTPLVCVWRKEKNDIRLCLDFRQLNLITERQAFPMPNITELLDKLEGTRFFSSIDLGNAYYQVELDEESKEKTAFSTKTGQYCFNRMPFGIAAAPGTFQELMNKVLDKMKNTVVYLDDILIFTESKEQHYEVLDKVLKRITKAGLRINPNKCHILKEEVKFLGYIINEKGIKTDPTKLEAISSFEKPKCIKNLRSFLGICNYYRKFIKDYAKKAKLLEGMCGLNNKKLIWTENCEKTFEEMKKALTSTPILGYPNIKKEFILDTDASFDTIGAVLSQRDDYGHERVIAYGSHTMNSHEKGYCITRKELLAIYYFCQHFNHYLYGKRFTLRTDHKAITFMLSTKKPITSQFQTWINYLSSLDINLVYRKGSEHCNADMLSRNICGTCSQCMLEHEDAKVEKMKTKRINALDEKEIQEWQKDSEEIENIRQEIKSGTHWKFQLRQQTIVTKEGKIWIPKEKRKEMIKKMHVLLTHAGAEKVMKYITDNYDMYNLKEEVKETIRHCEPCQRTKTITTKTKEDTIRLTAKEPWEKIYIDICGPLQETFRKKKYIIAIIDQYSKYISLSAVSKQDDETVKDTIMTKWILKFGAPKEIHMDCGKVFESKRIAEMAIATGTKLCFSSPYHHNTNGIIERQFRTIRDYINCSIQDRKIKDWAMILPDIEFTLNATFQKTIGRSPAEIVFGKKINREHWYSQRDETQEEKKETEQTERKFNIGDEVLVKVELRSKDKERYEGPYRIIQKVHDRRYKMRKAIF